MPTPSRADCPPGLLADLMLDWLAEGLADRLASRLAPLLASRPPEPPAAPEPLVLSLVEVAHRLSVSRSTASELVHSGQLPCVRVGTKVHVSSKALARYIAQHEGVYGTQPVEPARPHQRPARRRPTQSA